METELILSYIIFRKEMALKMGINVLVCLILLLASIYFFKSRFLALFFVLIMILPLLLLKIVMKIFRREVRISLERRTFSIEINKEGSELRSVFKYSLDEFRSYNIQLPNRRFSSIKFTLKNGKTVEYSFLKEKVNDDQIGTDELIDFFHSNIQDYNKSTSDSEKILFQPSFFASVYGLSCIIALSCLFMVAIVLHFLYHLKSLPVTLFLGFALIIQLLLRRKADIEYYKKMR